MTTTDKSTTESSEITTANPTEITENPEEKFKNYICYLNGEANGVGCDINNPGYYQSLGGSENYFSTDDGGSDTKYKNREIRNEDAVGFRTQISPNGRIIDEVVIADGMGGGGANAHRAAYLATKNILERDFSDSDPNLGLIEAVNKTISDILKEFPAGNFNKPPSTCFLYYGIDQEGYLHGAAMGDCQLIIVDPNNDQFFESDAENVAYSLYKSAIITKNDYFNHSQKNRVFNGIMPQNNSITEDKLKNHFRSEKPLTGGTLVVAASDGLWDILHPSEVAEAIKGLTANEAYFKIRDMILAIRDRKHKSEFSDNYPHSFDNITFHVRGIPNSNNQSDSQLSREESKINSPKTSQGFEEVGDEDTLQIKTNCENPPLVAKNSYHQDQTVITENKEPAISDGDTLKTPINFLPLSSVRSTTLKKLAMILASIGFLSMGGYMINSARQSKITERSPITGSQITNPQANTPKKPFKKKTPTAQIKNPSIPDQPTSQETSPKKEIPKNPEEMHQELNALNTNNIDPETLTLINNYKNIAAKINPLGVVDFIDKLARTMNLSASEVIKAKSYLNRFNIFGNNYNGSAEQNEILKHKILAEFTKHIYSILILKTDSRQKADAEFKKFLLSSEN